MAVIHPEISITPDQPTIRFRDPMDKVDLDRQMPSILQAQGWGCGTYFNVQFISHERDQLLADARFVVVSEKESLKTTDSAYTPNTRVIVAFRAEQVTDWRYYNGYDVPRETLPAQTREAELGFGTNGKPVMNEVSENSGKQAIIKWNPGKKEHELLVGDEVVFSSANKAEVEAKLEGLNKAA